MTESFRLVGFGNFLAVNRRKFTGLFTVSVVILTWTLVDFRAPEIDPIISERDSQIDFKCAMLAFIMHATIYASAVMIAYLCNRKMEFWVQKADLNAGQARENNCNPVESTLVQLTVRSCTNLAGLLSLNYLLYAKHRLEFHGLWAKGAEIECSWPAQKRLRSGIDGCLRNVPIRRDNWREGERTYLHRVHKWFAMPKSH